VHVGLPAAEPDIADQDVVEFDRLMAFDGQGVGTACGRWLKLRLPTMVGAGDGGGGFTGDFNGDVVAGLGPAPDGIGFVALEDHVIGEDGA